MSGTIIVVINAQGLRLNKSPSAQEQESEVSNDLTPHERRDQKTVTTRN